MGMAGIKWGPYPSTIHSFSINLNEEAPLKVSFKNSDKFQSCSFSKTTFFSKRALKVQNVLKNQIFFHFWEEFCRAFQWYIVCLNTLSGYRGTEGNIAVPFQLATIVLVCFGGDVFHAATLTIVINQIRTLYSAAATNFWIHNHPENKKFFILSPPPTYWGNTHGVHI